MEFNFFKNKKEKNNDINNFDYVQLKELVLKAEKNGLKDDLSFLSFISLDDQIDLLKEEFNDDTILRMFTFFNPEAISNFFIYNIRGRELYKKIYIPRFLEKGVKFNDDIVKSKDFFDALKSFSFVEFRTNINNAEKYNNPIFIEKRLKEYYDELISDYNFENKVFNKYLKILECDKLSLKDEAMDEFIMDSSISYELLEMIRENPEDKEIILNILRDITNIKLSEIIIDAIFQDNYYNICLNINEMIRYNKKLNDTQKILDKNKINFYKTILNFDSLDSTKKVEMYRKLKDSNYNFIFYNDLRSLKDISYEKIKNDIFKIDNFTKYKDEISSKKYNVDIYNLKDVQYTMLVRKIRKFNDKTNIIRNCYSLISDENTQIFDSKEEGFLYGYNTFENDKVLHVLETDSNSIPSKEEASKFVNRIMTSDEIIKSSYWYNEIQILNSKNDDCYSTLVPDYLVVFDDVYDRFIQEAKRLNIPIVLITKKDIEKDKQTNIILDRENDIYVSDVYCEELRKRHR